MTRERAEEYRQQARECLDVARTAPPGAMRTTLIDAAQTWLRLAKEQEHEDANIDLPPPSPVEEQPAVQQQQQEQPKDDDKKE
jgi:hypothetical protein